MPLLAEGPKPFPDFTFKKVTPPAPGTSKRITVQVGPNVPEAAAPASEGAPAAVTSARYDWFWQDVSPAIADTGPGRLEAALTALATASAENAVAAPRLDSLLAIANAHAPQILISSVNSRVSPALVLSVIAVESSGRSDAVSGAGAQGLMQLLPATAERFDVQDAMDPGQNIRGGVAYLDWLLREFQDDPVLALAAYNAGENAVKKHEGVPPYPETRDYVPKVLAAFAVAKALCKTPPELISDGCVFNLTP
jgi:soluble lytic murein transglycosylase-like protein